SLSGGTFAFSDKHVGTGKTVTVDSVTVNDGNSGANYEVSYVANTNSTITPATLTLDAVSDNKRYDGTTDSSENPTVTGLMDGDSLSDLSQSFDSKNVLGTDGSTLSVNTDYVLDDGNAGNHYLVVLNT